MYRLQKLNLVEKMLTNPVTFKAIMVNDAMAMLLKHKLQEYQEAEKNAKEIIQKYARKQEKHIINRHVEESKLTMIPDEIATFRKLVEMVENNQESFDIIIYLPPLIPYEKELIEVTRKAFEKNLKIRFIVCFTEGQKIKWGKFPVIFTKFDLNARYLFLQDPVTMLIVDNREALINTGQVPVRSPSLWSNNPVIVSLASDYFERKWNDSNRVPLKRRSRTSN